MHCPNCKIEVEVAPIHNINEVAYGVCIACGVNLRLKHNTLTIVKRTDGKHVSATLKEARRAIQHMVIDY